MGVSLIILLNNFQCHKLSFSITFLGLLRTFDHKIQKTFLHAITELHDFLRQGLFMEIFVRLGELFLRTIKVIDMDFFDRHSIILLFRIFRPFKSIVVHASINSSNKSTKYRFVTDLFAMPKNINYNIYFVKSFHIFEDFLDPILVSRNIFITTLLNFLWTFL